MTSRKYNIEEAKSYIAGLDAFHEIVDGIPAVAYIDADDDLNTPLFVSPQIEQLLGYTVEEWMSDPRLWSKHVHPDDQDWVFDDNLRHIAEAGLYRAEYRMLTVDGRTIWVRDEASVIFDEKGDSVGWRGLLLDVTELKEAEQKLRRSLDMLRDAMAERRLLLRRVEDSEEQERRRIANNIHDDSIQVMASVSLRIQALHSSIPLERQEALNDVREIVDESIDRLRHLVFELRPPALDSKGLVVALRQYLERTGAEVGFDYRVVDKLALEPPSDVRLQLYRIAQEAISNVGRHADARLVQVKVEHRGSGVGVRIEDDGKGFNPGDSEPAPGHLGTSAMRERAEMANGVFDIKSEPGGGTVVEFWLPTESPTPSDV